MSRAKLIRRVSLSVVVLIVVALVVGTVVGVSLVRRPFPQTDGELAVSGLTSKVTVLRDDRGVPQIYADNSQDLFRAQGFVAAQDRFFEMDVRRHITAGRLSELIGKDGIETDRVIRTMGWRKVAEAELPTLAASTRQYLQAYADGVNAYITKAGSPDKMAVEYSVLGQKFPDYRVEPWAPADSLAWLKAMAWDLRGDYDNELTRARLSGSITPARFAQIFPPYPMASHQPILSGSDWTPGTGTGTGTSTQSAASAVPKAVNAPRQPAVLSKPSARAVYAEVAKALDQLPVMVGRGDGIGSNSWVVGPQRSSTGKPLLANDPHLGVGIPGVWYQTGLHCRTVTAACPFDVAGYSFAGLPGIVIGHNQNIAWGITNLGPDVSDFYLEQIRGETYRRGRRYLPLNVHTETIKVAGGRDVSTIVRTTAHGPLLSDVIPKVAQAGRAALVGGKPENASYDVSLAWTGLLPGHTADAIFKLNIAKNFTQFRAAAKDFAVPAQNLLYADTQGHIGYQAPGQVPIRASSMPGAPAGYWPAPGWDAKYDWKGFVPFEQMPTSYDPPEGYIVAANQAVTASKTPFLTSEWDYGFRSERIRTLINATPKVTPARMSQIQGDTYNGFAPELVKALLAVNLSTDAFTEESQDLLRSWDFTQPGGKSPTSSAAGAAFYNAVWSNILQLTFNDELGDMKADGGSQWMQALSGLLAKPRDIWWDNKLTPGVIEGRDEILRQAMVRARMDLTKKLGKQPVTWQWGRLHQVTLEHQILGGDSVAAPIRAIFNRGPWQMPGGSAIVNANGWDASKGYQVDWAPSMRMVVNLGDLDASRWVNQTGNSGHPYDDHYVDQADAWVNNRTFPWLFSQKAVREAGGDELTLTPDASGN
ncbi:MAG TPA: penicillin acylase family protein [Dermatophilaceae bacterium]|nr:penicillin acylase family protein [Dermatophilaceae bacterium]